MVFTIVAVIVLGIAVLPTQVLTETYNIVKSYEGQTFFDDWYACSVAHWYLCVKINANHVIYIRVFYGNCTHTERLCNTAILILD
jgi:hypothetical protein